MTSRSRDTATRAVDRAVTRFVTSSAEERLRLYRLELQAGVRLTSTLAIDLARQSGLYMSAIADGLPVPRHWPGTGRMGSWRTPKGARARMGPMTGPRQPSVTRETAERLRDVGVAVRGRHEPGGDLGFVPERGVLEVVSRVGGTSLHTNQGVGYLVLSQVLPDVILLAAEGRPVDAIVSHVAVDGRDYRVDAAYVDEFVGGSVLRFPVGLVPLHLPWAGELALEVARQARTEADEVASLLGRASPMTDVYGARHRGG